MLADGPSGRADPAFEAHLAPIGMWAEAVWSGWLPRSALASIVKTTRRQLASCRSTWGVVRGPGAAFVASAQRLGWEVCSATEVTTDSGQNIDLCRDSPAFVREEVVMSVKRWRSRRIEGRMPFLKQKEGGYGIHIMPIHKLLNGPSSEDWGPTRGPQVHLHKSATASVPAEDGEVCGAWQLYAVREA